MCEKPDLPGRSSAFRVCEYKSIHRIAEDLPGLQTPQLQTVAELPTVPGVFDVALPGFA